MASRGCEITGKQRQLLERRGEALSKTSLHNKDKLIEEVPRYGSLPRYEALADGAGTYLQVLVEIYGHGGVLVADAGPVASVPGGSSSGNLRFDLVRE